MNNQILIVFDSLRWDVFKSAHIPFLRSLGNWKKAYTQGTYTLPAHMSFFVGKLPQTLIEEDYYDAFAKRYDKKKKWAYRTTKQLWRLDNPEAARPAKYGLEGKNIIEGFSKKGYLTIGTGGVNWFNPELPAGRLLTEPFEKFRFFDSPDQPCTMSAESQIDWVLDSLQAETHPYFLFINFGETHHEFAYKNCEWYGEKDPYGNKKECLRRQRRCLEYLDKQVEKLLAQLTDYDVVLCSDHGEVLGENGLWGHGFYHKKVMEIPFLIKLQDITPA